MDVNRHLDWEGCFNARDLGGLRTVDGGRTRWRAIVRSDSLDGLSADGWAAARAYGVRTIVDLRTHTERADQPGGRPADLTTVPMEDHTVDADFWRQWRDSGLWATPLYFQAFLDRFPARVAATVAAVATARPGGVVVHCGSGRNRTQLVTLVLLALAGVGAHGIADDYELSAERMPALFASLGRQDDGPAVRRMLAERNTTAHATIRATVAALDPVAYLRSAGLAESDLAAVRERLLGPGSSGVSRCDAP
jgi:protein-tyrosine phosphatase